MQTAGDLGHVLFPVEHKTKGVDGAFTNYHKLHKYYLNGILHGHPN